MARHLVLVLLMFSLAHCCADTALIPLKHVDATLLNLMFGGRGVTAEQVSSPMLDAPFLTMGPKPVPNVSVRDMRPAGIQELWAARWGNALVVRGTEAAIRELRDLIALLDTPTRRVAIEAKIVVAPVSGPGAFKAEWRDPAKMDFATGELDAEVKRFDKRGQVYAPQTPSPSILLNNTSKTIWWVKDVPGLDDPAALACGLYVVPRINNNTTTIFLCLFDALDDETQGVKFEPVLQMQINVKDGESCLLGGWRRGGGAEAAEDVLLMLTARMVREQK